ncbi:hypothetical protein F4009_21865, partial [Candidatus Poribacteria bacterium]|nr:hypothetical protein [Candidatus Poribacteria bacterium]
MKILTVAVLIVIMMGGQLYADNPSAANNKITLNLDDTSKVLVKGFIAPVRESLSDNFIVKLLINYTDIYQSYQEVNSNQKITG